MSEHSLTLSGFLSAGALVSSLVIGQGPVTGATVIDNEHGFIREYSQRDFLTDCRDIVNNPDIVLNHYENITIGLNAEEDDYFEPEVIEIPVIKRMVFQFKKPVDLEFA